MKSKGEKSGVIVRRVGGQALGREMLEETEGKMVKGQTHRRTGARTRNMNKLYYILGL